MEQGGVPKKSPEGVSYELKPEDLNDEYKKASRCGCGSCSPKWLQKLASKKIFLLVFGLMGLNHSAFSSYFVGTITTLEKRFKLPSASFGIVSSAWDIGAITASLFIAYFGSSGNRAKWVGCCALLPALGCILRYYPHYYLGPGTDLALENSIHNGTSRNFSRSNDPLCLASPLEENCSVQEEGMIALAIFTATHFITGLGTAAYYTLGAAFLDDNVPKNKFPLLLGIVTSLRYIGPAAGFTLASYALNQYIDPNVKSVPIGKDDARWIGAWYLGWIPFGIVEFVVAIILMLFPRWLPREACRRQKANLPVKWEGDDRSFKDFKQTMKRLLTNKIIVLNTVSTCFYLFGLSGYWLFMPKYIETQFTQTAATASIVTGAVGLLCTAAGVLSSGVIISQFKPRPFYLAAWNVFAELVDAIGRMAFAFIGCEKDNIHGSYNSDGSWNLTTSCNAGCECDINLKYSPVCSTEGVTYYSSCHAGCLSSTIQNSVKTFINCTCLPEKSYATEGPCPGECGHQFAIFLFLLCTMQFLSSSGRAGNTIIQYRSVLPKDKSVSIAFSEVVLCAFTFIPAPIMFGMIIDSSCLIWGYSCGKVGNCWFYSDKELRYLLNFTSAGFILIATFFDVGVMFNVSSLQIYDEKNETVKKQPKEGENEPSEEPLMKERDETKDDERVGVEAKEVANGTGAVLSDSTLSSATKD